ncbi:hypothetical protein FE257_005562 [Aspergillus nanangensis]|uniref:Uncharacterized protein n=1 Tax=Aspergillus nanangensis TaxID=2582783 RepID=A0AAD4GVE4_ASPNN|nr:hypothetical protein FE257_005562 [Aspergillus nanangensis]
MDEHHRTIWLNHSVTPTAGKRSLLESAWHPGKRWKPEAAACDDGCHDQDPWAVYRQRAVVSYGRCVILAHHREHPSKIVNIQCVSVNDRPSTRSLLQTVERLSHDSFVQLLEAYYHKGELFLVWELVELLTLQGIVFLRDQGRALAKLDSDAILLKRDGVVRVTGAEHSCQIQRSEMNSDTLKLTALAIIMADLMKQNANRSSWSSTAKGFLRDLTAKLLDELLKDSFLKQAGVVGDLTLCVIIVNKLANHNIKEVDKLDSL